LIKRGSTALVLASVLAMKLVLRPDLIPTQGPELFEVEFGAASRIDFDGAHACE